MSDQVILCRDCNQDFTFTEGEQEFYDQKGLSAPQRCKDCRAKKKMQFNDRQMHDAVCAECGQNCTVPFKPSGERPVLCKDCFKK